MNTNEQTIHQMGLGISNLVKQATGRESVSSIDMDWVSVEQLARYIYGSGSGDVVSFDTNIPDAIESLIAYITAVQDLHEFDSPWPLGAGVNKSLYTVESIKSATSGTWTGNSITINGIEFTILTDADNNVTGININGTSTGTAVLNLYDTSVNPFTEDVKYRVNGLWADGSAETFKHDVLHGTSGVAVVDYTRLAGSVFTASADVAAATRIRERLVIYSGITLDNVKFYPMISVYADTVPDFVQPSNICPITGWTGCNVTRCGKNLIGTGTLYAADTLYSVDGAASVNTNFDTYRIKSVANEKYTISVIPADTNMCVRVLQFNNAMVFDSHITSAQGTANTRKSVTITSTCDGWLIVSVRKSATDQMIELGETATAYEEYQGEVYAFTFPAAAGTVYGGTLDVLSGVLTVDKGIVDLGDLEWTYNTSGTQPFMQSSGISSLVDAPSSSTIAARILCSALFSGTAAAIYSGSVKQGIAIHSNGTIRAVYPNMPTDPTDFKTEVDGIQLVYPLKTVATYQLTAQEVEALVGENNIFADTGNVSVQYKVKEDLV